MAYQIWLVVEMMVEVEEEEEQYWPGDHPKLKKISTILSQVPQMMYLRCVRPRICKKKYEFRKNG